jgi:hypothetical protein
MNLHGSRYDIVATKVKMGLKHFIAKPNRRSLILLLFKTQCIGMQIKPGQLGFQRQVCYYRAEFRHVRLRYWLKLKILAF